MTETWKTDVNFVECSHVSKPINKSVLKPWHLKTRIGRMFVEIMRTMYKETYRLYAWKKKIIEECNNSTDHLTKFDRTHL